MTEVTSIRRLRAGDLTDLVDLCREHAAYERAPWQERDREADLAALFLEGGDCRCWVVETPTELAGFASASMELSTWDAGRYVYLDCLFLRPAYRGRGLGRALMERVARVVLESGAVGLQWQTPIWNDDAARFYRRLGAESKEKLRFAMSPGECVQLLGDVPSPGTSE